MGAGAAAGEQVEAAHKAGARGVKISKGLGTLILQMLEKRSEDRPWPAEIAKAITKFLNARETTKR